MLTVYGRPDSSNSAKVFWLLDAIGEDYRLVAAGTGYGPTDTAEFRALNPFGRVPVIVDGDTVVWESNVVLRYLAGRFGARSLWPTDPAGQAAIDRWMDWSAISLVPALLKLRRANATGAAGPTDIADVVAQFTALDEQLTRSRYIAGERLSLADIAAAPAVHRWFLLTNPRPELKHLADYARRLSGDPGYCRHVRDRLT